VAESCLPKTTIVIVRCQTFILEKEYTFTSIILFSSRSLLRTGCKDGCQICLFNKLDDDIADDDENDAASYWHVLKQIIKHENDRSQISVYLIITAISHRHNTYRNIRNKLHAK